MKEPEYTPTIGLEIHAELSTRTKMFCDSLNAPDGAAPNTHICPICMGHPGTLPTINKKAVESVVTVGLALEGKIASYTEFDRKNYFYPDIPKGYQISQYAYPIVSGGELLGIRITRVHLEEDTARSLHDQGDGTIVDYNRAGVPLMELVTEPDIHDAETAARFATELQLLLRALNVSEAHMEKGQMRIEANISVGKDGALGTKVEVKNLNSFKSVESAIRYEIARQIKVLEEGGSVVQETRGWDEVRQQTFSQRKKESSHDYRYFPDPDLPKLNLTQGVIDISRLSENLSEIPSNKRLYYENLGVSRNQIEMLVSDRSLRKLFDEVSGKVDQRGIAIAANYITSDVVGLLAREGKAMHENAPLTLASLVNLIVEQKITSRVAKDLLPEVLFEGVDPLSMAQERGLLQEGSEELLASIVAEILKDHAGVVEEYRAGKVTALQFLIGQGMRLSKGRVSPDALKTHLISRMG
jgi:aspartyl-tRNA(Asn)/glutamyl-tRNA(Gln) amidotransferase subunit B